MSKPKLSEALCQKLIDIVAIYIKNYPEEYKQFRKEQAFYQGNLKNPFAEVSGMDGVVIRELLRLPERFDTLLKLSLSTNELMEWCREVNHVPIYQIWFGNKFSTFRATKGSL